MSVEVKVECDECSESADVAFCKGCFEGEKEEAQAAALVGYVPEYDSAEEAKATIANMVSEWTEREKALGRLSASDLAVLERCAEDLR